MNAIIPLDAFTAEKLPSTVITAIVLKVVTKPTMRKKIQIKTIIQKTQHQIPLLTALKIKTNANTADKFLLRMDAKIQIPD